MHSKVHESQMLTSFLQESQVTLEKSRSRELSNAEKNQWILEQWRLLCRTLAFSLSFLSFSGENYQGNIGDNDVSIQISLLPCLCWMFASCVRKTKKKEKRSDNIWVSSPSDACSIIQVGGYCAATSLALTFLSLAVEEFCREGSSEDMKKQRLHRRIVASQHLISDKVRLVYKSEAAQSVEKSRRQVGQIPCHR
jgi:hypothetical protein